MKTRLPARVLSLLLVFALLTGMAVPAAAVSPKSDVTFTQVDNSAVSVSPLPSDGEKLTNTEEYAATDVVRVSILMEKDSAIQAGFSPMGIADNQAAAAYRQELKNDQTVMISRIEKAIRSDLDVVWNLTLAANLISANVEYGQIQLIEKLPGVKSVVLEAQYLPNTTESSMVSPSMATSTIQTGSDLAWNAGYTGAGTRIAVIDTGIDTDHQSLSAAAFEYALSQLAEEAGMSDEAYTESLDLLDAAKVAAVADDLNVAIDPQTTYVNSKIPFAYNYKDGDYDITHDNDDQGEHGSHVSGIAAANSWLDNGDGTFVRAMEQVYMQGVAPEAQLLTMKVFGKTGSPYDSDYMAAIEDAIVLGADVVNLSLGSLVPGRGAHSNPVFEAVMDDLTESGVVVAISAGNSGPWAEYAENGGYLYADDVSQDTVGQPGSFTNSLAVASVENDGMVGYYITVDGEMIVYNENLFNDQLPFTAIAGEHEYVFLDGVGKAEDWAAVADVLPGKVAICSRGETNFAEKATLAVEAGAVAVLIYNNQSGMINLDLTDYHYTAPVAALSQVQGAAIRAASTPVTDGEGNVRCLTGKLTVSDTVGMGQFNSAYYTMSTFSSWGVPGSLEMKPEITAPGGSIYSLNGLDTSGTGYELMSGTSMASPQVAGMSALMAQYVRENGLAEKTGLSERYLIQSLLMSTATPLLASEGVYYPVLQQGAGLANVYDAITADSYITMADGSSSGDADGKVKVELYDDPDRVGSYSASFTVNNLSDEDKTLNLNADFFTQATVSDGTFSYMDYTTAMLAMDVSWSVEGIQAQSLDMEGMDFNGDGLVNTADGQALLDYATGVITSLTNQDLADVDGDGDIDSHDAYVFLRDLNTTTATLPAGGSVEISVRFSLTPDARADLEESFPNGAYIQGFLYAETVNADGTDGTAHSIPVLGFYGNWTDPSMFDVGQWTTFATGEDARIPYIGRTRGNDFKVIYDWDPGYSYSLGGNPVITDSVYMPERNAINSNDALAGVSFIAIRNADQSRVTVTNETTGNVLLDQQTGAVNMAYYYGALGWQNSGMTLQTNFSLNSASEDDVISMDFTLVPEYYLDAEGNVDWDALGHGVTLSTSLVIDNTAPELQGVSIDLMTNSMTVTASDNQYVAAVGLYNKTGTRCLASTGAQQDIEKGETAQYTFSLDGVNGKKFLVQVFDYAMNAATYLVEMQIGESTDLPDMMAFDLVSRHWAGFSKDFEYDYRTGTPRVAYSDFIVYAATIAEHYVFASSNTGDLYVMPEDDLSDTTFITDLDMVLYDMAYNSADGEIYAVNEKNELVTIHKLSGDVTLVGTIGVNTNTLACSPEGVFYCNELGTGKVYSFTLDTMSRPKLLMEDPYLTYVDPIAGADMGGTTGNMGMEYDPNTGMICWNSHCEVLIGSYITYAYFYEIDPVTGEFTRYNDFWHEMAGLIIPVRSGSDNSWASPTDKVMAVKLNKSEIDVIRGTTAQLTANVQPWTAIDRTVTWSSADESIATVSKNGVITGVAEGTTTIRATSNLDPSKYAECTVNVEILDVTLHGTLMDAEGSPMFYDWNLASGETWTAGNALDVPMTSATYSTLKDVYYLMDNDPDSFRMYKVSPDGQTLATADNPNGVPLWDMSYSEVFTRLRGKEQVTSIYYYYLLSPKDPMALNAVGFNLSSLASYLVGVTSLGAEQIEDENGDIVNSEHLILLDSDGYIWDFWIYDVAGGSMNAMYAITRSDLPCEFPGDETLDNMYTSLMAGEDGALYLSAFNGATNEIYYLTYDEDAEQYASVLLGTVGKDVWPATITSVTMNGTVGGNSASPAPIGTMSAETISQAELAAASQTSREPFSVTLAELRTKLGLASDHTGTKDDPFELVVGDNTIPSEKSTYGYAKFVADSDGTATLTIGGTDWRYQFYHYDASGNELSNFSYGSSNDPNGGVITAELKTGESILLGVTPYVSYTMPAGEVSVNLAFGDAQPEPDPEPGSGTELILGENTLSSGTEYTYTAAADGRLEFDFSNLKDSAGNIIYQYAYGKADRVKLLVNGTYVEQLLDTKLTVSKGDTVTVELAPVDADSYTVTLKLAALAPASRLVLGENAISRKTDYSYFVEEDGTLYTSIKELWCDGTYCTAASLSSTVVFKINGSTVYSFDNSYEVKAGDEITVYMTTQFGESASAVLWLSTEGFYKHPIGSRGNPYTLAYAECPAESAEIPAGSAVWYRLSGFGSGYNLTVSGEDAYVIVGGTRIDAKNGAVTVPASTNLQIGNSGTEDAAFTLSASITEGYPDNPKDLAEGDNTVVVDKSDNYYYDFTAAQAGTATVTVSGDNWRFWFSHFDKSGDAIVSEEDHRQAREDADTVTVDLKAGESIVIKLGTMTSTWTAPGGELTVNFHFEPSEGGSEECEHANTEVRDEEEATCTEPGYTGDTYCIDCGELVGSGESIPALGHDYQDGSCTRCGQPDPAADPDHALSLGKNTLESGAVYAYVVPADGRMEFTVNSVKNSAGSKLYSWTNGQNVQIQIDGVALTKSSMRTNVTAGQVITVQVVPVDEDTYTAELTLTELEPAQELVLGENDIAQDLEHLYVAEKSGTLYISIVELLYNGAPATESDLGSSILYKINGSSVSSFNKSIEVKSGDEVTIVLEDYSWDGSGTVSGVVSLSYDSFYEHPAGSLANPVELMYADCPTETIEIAAGTAAWYELESYYDENAWSTVYPFEDKYLVVTGEDAYLIVDGTRYDAEDGVVKVMMDDTTLIQIGNDGTDAAVFGLAVEIPEGHKDNPKDLAEGDNTVTLPSYGSYYYDFTADRDGTVTVTVSGENWKFSFTHYDAQGNQLSTKDYYAKNDDTDTVTVELTAGESIVVMVGTSKGYTQPGGDVTVNFHFEPAVKECAHENTELRDDKAPTCTEPGYTGDTWCLDCETLLTKGAVIPATGHDYQDGVCANCGEAEPGYNTVIVEVVNDVDATNGVVTVTWDPAKLTLTGISIHADYTSMLEDEGSVTFGYVSLMGIPAGRSVATLTFEAVDPKDAVVTIEHKQINNDSSAPCRHEWSDWTKNDQDQDVRSCIHCGQVQVNPFVDVDVDSFCIEPVLWAVENGITKGITDTTFCPKDACTRAQAVTFLWRAAGCPEPASQVNPFEDVKEGTFYYTAVLWAVEVGITKGMDATHFAPELECTRGQIVTFLWRAEGCPEAAGENPFTDMKEGAFYEKAVLWAVANGITEGIDDTHFAPMEQCTRGQIVTFLYRAYA